jgi:hypothetical protein
MTAKQSAALAARLEKLRNQWSAAQAAADQLRASIARLEGKAAGEPTPQTGLDMLWAAAPPMARTRSSKHACRTAWNRIPQADRPRVADAVSALRAWTRCEEWRKDDGLFIPALHRWIKERRWEDLPESSRNDPRARYRCTPAAPAPPPPEEIATPEELEQIFADFRAKFK